MVSDRNTDILTYHTKITGFGDNLQATANMYFSTVYTVQLSVHLHFNTVNT